MLTRFLVTVVLVGSVAQAQPTLITAPTFSTTSTTFVDVPGARLVGNPAPSEAIMMFWKARLSSNGSGSASAELQIVGASNSIWGHAVLRDNPSSRPMWWTNFDWQVGVAVDLQAQVRSLGGGATVTVDGFEAVLLSLGPGPFPAAEPNMAMPITISDAQWTTLGTLNATGTGVTDWLLLVQAELEPGATKPVALHVRHGNELLPLSATRRELQSTRPRGFSLMTHVRLPAGDALVVEATVDPRDAGVPAGATAVLRGVRSFMIPSRVLPLADTSTASGSPGPSGSLSVAELPVSTATPGSWELVVMSAAIGTDAGFLELGARSGEGAAPDFQPVTVSDLGETTLFTSWAVRQVTNNEVAPGLFASAVQGLDFWGSSASRWQLDAGFLLPDGGVFDAGLPDAGSPDAGDVDAGVDAGTVDAGASSLDAGSEDAGTPTRRTTQVGCGCGVAPLWPLALFAWAVRRRRALVSR